MPYIKLNNFDMYCEEAGTGEPIVFIHGSLSDSVETFRRQFPFFSKNYKCICVDLRSHGRSIYPQFDWNTENLADDVIALMNELDIEKAHFVGHSMGGDVAMYCGLKHPEKVRTITSICSAGMVNGNVTAYLEQLNPERIDKVKLAKFIDKMQSNYGELWKDMVKHIIWNCGNYPDFSENQLAQIKAPFLLIRGGRDNMVLDEEVELLRKNIPDFSYCLIEDGGHFLHGSIEFAEAVNQRIEGFFHGNCARRQFVI